jgi:hypothetical protein
MTWLDDRLEGSKHFSVEQPLQSEPGVAFGQTGLLDAALVGIFCSL